jgi:hypothetical protein
MVKKRKNSWLISEDKPPFFLSHPPRFASVKTFETRATEPFFTPLLDLDYRIDYRSGSDLRRYVYDYRGKEITAR